MSVGVKSNIAMQRAAWLLSTYLLLSHAWKYFLITQHKILISETFIKALDIIKISSQLIK